MTPVPGTAVEAVALNLGGVVVRVRLDGLEYPYRLEPHYRPFLSEAPPDLDLVYRRGVNRDAPSETLFESGGVWTLHRLVDGRLRFDLDSDALGDEPYAQAVIASDLRTGEVLLRSLEGHLLDGGILPFVYPLDEVLTMVLLSRRRGLLVHAAGIEDRGRGLLFPGVSGAGKSTFSRIWRYDRTANVLTDDRVIARFEGELPVIHGTPWHGEAELCGASSAPLAAIFFLEQAPVNEAVPVRRSEAAAELLARSFPTWWDGEGIAWALEAADRITSAVPAYRLRFRPERGALDAVRQVIDAG